MDWVSKKFKAGFQEFKERTNVGASHLEDVGALVDDNLFERDILIATKKLACLSNISERTQVKDLGHLAWSGGPSAAKFAGNQLVNLLSLLNNESSIQLKMFTIQAISEICCANKENQDKARYAFLLQGLTDKLQDPEEKAGEFYGLIDKLAEILSTTEPELSTLRRSTTACLLTLSCENHENQKSLLSIDRLQEYLTSISVENWSAWDENEAAQLISFLGLDHPVDAASRWAKIRKLCSNLGGKAYASSLKEHFT